MGTPDFSNTQIAFARHSSNELRKAYYLFRFMKRPSNVAFGRFLLNIALAIRFPIRWIVKPTIFHQFCGGETLNECIRTIDLLAKSKVGAIPDYSAEGLGTELHCEAVKQEVLRVIAYAAKHRDIPFCVFKPSGIIRSGLLEKVTAGIPLNETEKNDYEKGVARFRDLCNTAALAKVRMLVDAEESWIQGAIDQLTEEMMLALNISEPLIFQTVQMYRVDRLEYLKSLCNRCEVPHRYAGFKIVRGAYMEKERARALAENRPSPIHPDKENTDRAYNEAMLFCMERVQQTAICLGTHNEESTLLLTQQMDKLGIDKQHRNVCFAQLLGMSDHLTFNLAHQSYNTAKYVPYGPVRLVMPYLVRRASENTAVAGQTSRELNLIYQELKRRRRAL